MADPISRAARRSLFAPKARLPEGWRSNVLLQWDEAGTLTRVSPDTAQDDLQSCPNIEYARGPLLAGMPNLHSHAFQAAMAGLTEYRASATDSFWSWRDLMYRFAAKISPEHLSAITQYLYLDMLKAGYTSVCEFHYVHHRPDGYRYARPAEMAERIVDAAGRIGIAITLLPVLYQYSDFGARPPHRGQQRFINTPEQLLGLLGQVRQAYPESPNRRYGIAPHSLRAVSRASLDAVLTGLHTDLPEAPIHIHIAEQTAEVDACIASEGARPVRWLLDHYPIDSRWCLIHATHIDAHETRSLAASGAIAGLCPSTEANLGDGFFPTSQYLAAEGRIGVGSDSHICVDWRSELRLLEYNERLRHRQRNVLSSADQPRVADRLFDEATRGGAMAAGRASGALETGRQADCVVLDPDHASIAGQHSDTWLSGIVFSERGLSPVMDVYVAGRRLIDSRHHIDEERIKTAYRNALSELLE